MIGLEELIEVEKEILATMKSALIERRKSGRRDSFNETLREALMTQGCRVAALERIIKK